MIELTRLNGNTIALNSDLIQSMEASPDTTLTLINGEKLVVRESLQQIIDRALAYRARLIAEAARLCPGGLLVASGAAWQTAAAFARHPIADQDRDIDEPAAYAPHLQTA